MTPMLVTSPIPPFLPALILLLQTTVQCESKKNPPLGDLTFFHFFHKRLRIANRFFTHLLNILIFTRLQIFIQLSPIFTKLCHIKHDYTVHIICAKCPKRARSDVCVSRWLLCWSLSVASHYKINTFIMSTNMWDMTWRQWWRHLLSKQT